jgi:multiple sugar transport system substrate-binding protein
VKKFLALVLGLMMAFSAMGVASAEADPVTVSVWCAYAGEDPYGKYVYEYADKFMAANPGIKVEVTAVSSNDIYAKLAAMATSPDDIPTLFYTSADQAPSLVDIGLVEDMTKYLTADDLAAFGNGVVEGCQVGGIMAYYPIDLQPLAVLYRIDRLEEAGLSLPTTWDEFLEVSKALTKDTDGDGKADQWGFSMVGSNNSSGQSRFMSYLWSNGLKVVFKDGDEWKTDIDTPEFLKAFTFWTDMNNVSHVVPEGITEITYPTAANYFAMGYTSLMVSGGNAMGVTYDAAPDLKGKIGTFPMPGIEPGSMMNTEGYALSANATEEEKKAAVEFCKFYATNDAEMRFWQESGKLPATATGLASEYLQGEDYAGFLQTIANGCRPVNDFPGMGALKGLLGDAYSAVFAGEKTNEQAVSDLAANMAELLEDYN